MPRRRTPLYLRLALLASLALGAVGVTSAAAAIPAPRVITAGLPPAATPLAIAAAPDGDAWFSQATPGMALGRVTPDGTIVEQPLTLPSAAFALSVGPDGDVWGLAGQDIVRVAPDGTVTDDAAALAALGPAPSLQGIAAASDGSLWLTAAAGAGSIARLTEQGALTVYSSGLTSGGGVDAIAAGPDGNMWFTESQSQRIGRITPQGTITEYGPTSGSPTEIISGPDGDLWFVEVGAFDGIGRITPAGVISEFPTGALAHDLAAGPDGQLYFTEPSGADDQLPFGSPAIGSMTDTGALTQEDIGVLFPFTAAWNIASAAGNLWLTYPGGPGAIGELSFAPEVTAGGSPTVGEDGVTVAGNVQANGELTTYYFQYGLTDSYGAQTPSQTVPPGTDVATVFASIANLAPGTPYHYRLVASNASGTTFGPDETFTTAAASITSTTSSVSASVSTTTSTSTSTDAPTSTTASAASTATSTSTTSATTDRESRTGPRPPSFNGVDGGLDDVDLSPLSLAGVVPGHSVASGPVSGTIYVRARGARERFRLRARAVLPVGSTVDARIGIVKLTALLRLSSRRHGTVARTSAVVGVPTTIALSGGLFSVVQPSGGGGPVVIELLGGRFRGCPTPGRARIAAARKARTRTPVVRQLWSSDSGGNFSTHGRDSVGTVQGTLWLTADRCDGTLTKVVRGLVQVRALHVRRRVLLHAGQSYLAPAARP